MKKPLIFTTPPRRWGFKLALIGILLLACYFVFDMIVGEMQSSRLQARYIAKYAADIDYKLQPGQSREIRFPDAGPFDERLGYTRIPGFVQRLGSAGFDVTHQVRFSPKLMELTDRGLFPPYREKAQGGLSLLDYKGDGIYSARYPERVYDKYESVPQLMRETLLFIENRELLDERYPNRNPAIEWDRFAKAAFEQLVNLVIEDYDSPGGSTLATQIEKYRHSPEGRTATHKEKLRQMISASLRAYRHGENTVHARRQILLDYLNTVPLGARPGFGEINGIGDGLWAWYGSSFEAINAALHDRSDKSLEARARAYKQILALMIAQRRPAYYLDKGRHDLEQSSNSHLRLLANAGIIPASLRDAALRYKLQFQNATPKPAVSFVNRKAATAMRANLSGLLGVPHLYDLDRYDLNVGSSLNNEAQTAVNGLLRGLKTAPGAKAAGLYGHNMLKEADDLSRIIISFTLFERGVSANFLRVQTDNYDQPFDINEGTKLDLGSTAKLRTLITYLEIIADLHQRYREQSPDELKKIETDQKDVLTRWGLDYLASAEDRTLKAMLAAAMERQYSANPGESFFTGGGLHTFENFRSEDNGRIMSVREGFRNSVNLVFVRLMRDIVRHYMFNTEGSSAKLLADANDPARQKYLARFADREGREFIHRFYKKYQGKDAKQAEELLLHGVKRTPKRLANIIRSIEPKADPGRFIAFMRAHLPDGSLSDPQLQKLYDTYAPEKLPLADRGYLAGIHPLELWLAGYLREHPDTTLTQAVEASSNQRQEVYTWLFKTRSKNAQDSRILSLLEVEGFLEIHRRWKRLGYPFEALTPSYATALGSSADRPAALAELMGIIVNKGMLQRTLRIEKLDFATGTPYETRLAARPGAGERVLHEAVAEEAKMALLDVVEQGTARRLKNAFMGKDGQTMKVGGKTGTGDHRFDVYGSGGKLISSRMVNRSATFAFLIGDRHFGTVTAYVPGTAAEKYDFTSAISVQILKSLAPVLAPMLETGSSN